MPAFPLCRSRSGVMSSISRSLNSSSFLYSNVPNIDLPRFRRRCPIIHGSQFLQLVGRNIASPLLGKIRIRGVRKSILGSSRILDRHAMSGGTTDIDSASCFQVDFPRIVSASSHGHESQRGLSDSVIFVNYPQEHGCSGGVEIEECVNQDREDEMILPQELLKKVQVLTCESDAKGGSCTVYLVGTAHVSQDSCKDVQAVISYLKPEVVFLELCSGRVPLLFPRNFKVPTIGEMVNMWYKNHNLFEILYSFILSKIGNKLEVIPGSEFRVAFEEARKHGCKVVLGDRPVQITLRRTWERMKLREKASLICAMLFQTVFLPNAQDLNKMIKEFDNTDVLTLIIQEMSKEYPFLMETLILERDKYMSYALLRVARQYDSVVAVVGKGHLPGIQKHWQQPIQVKDLLVVPSQNKQGPLPLTVISSLGFIVLGVAFISRIYLSRKK